MNPRRSVTIRSGFTLMELLVVIMVIGILASSLLFAMYNAVQQAKEARTKAQIAKLHELLMTRWDSYRTRAIRLQGFPPAARRDARAVATARLLALRDLMRLEMPDRKADVVDNPFTYSITYNTPSGPATATFNITRPACSREYLRRVAAATATWERTFQDSECLYMILASMQDIAGNGLDFLHEGEIADLDKDGMPEILDSWGKPIAFIRWAPGFVEHPGPDFTFQTTDDIPSYSNLQIVDPEGSPDPFDPLRIDKRAPVTMDSSGTAEYQFNFALYPLVFSGGPDELLDIVQFDYDDTTDPPTQVAFNFFRSGGGVVNDPYAILPTSGRRLGMPFRNSDGYKDNITNHGLGEGE